MEKLNHMLFDSHTHINNEDYNDEQRKQLEDEISMSDIAYVVDIGFDFPSSLRAVKDAEKNSWCYAAVGIHPHDAKTMDENVLLRLEALAAKEKVKAIGEIGLDFHYDRSERDVQKYWFRRQIQLANKLKMPMVIHSREADEETMNILKEENAFSSERQSLFESRIGEDGEEIPDSRVLIHCFSGSRELAKSYIKMGASLGICGPVTFKNNRRTIEVVKAIPLQFLMIETDAPYLTPEPFRGMPNKSPYLKYTAQKVAEIKGISYEEVVDITFNNASKFYDI